MAFTSDGIALPGIPLFGCSPLTAVRCRSVYRGLVCDTLILKVMAILLARWAKLFISFRYLVAIFY